MQPHVFKTTTVIKKPLLEVFEFFSKAENLNKITPPELQFEFVTPLPIAVHQGAKIEYKIKLSGIPFRWKTLISEWNPPYSFTDQQIKGPYRVWIHRHSFKALNDNETLMTDEVQFLSPGYFLEPLINKFFIEQKVKEIFHYREQTLQHLFQ